MFEIELTDAYNAKEIMWHITTATTKGAKFNIVRKKKNCYIMKVYTKSHILDVIENLKCRNEINKAHKITFKIDGIKHFIYIGMPY